MIAVEKNLRVSSKRKSDVIQGNILISIQHTLNLVKC